MSEKIENNTNVSIGFWFWFVAFLAFWLQSGWYRVDCAVGVRRACDLITAEYVAKDKP